MMTTDLMAISITALERGTQVRNLMQPYKWLEKFYLKLLS